MFAFQIKEPKETEKLDSRRSIHKWNYKTSNKKESEHDIPYRRNQEDEK
jgi:hypothetical protein